LIAESLRGLAVPVAALRSLEGNPRRGDVQAVARSLKRFGQRKPIVVRRSDNAVIAGNHTLAAALELGWSEIAVSWADDDDATAKAYALADNKTSALGSFDAADLAAMVAEVEAVDPELLLAASFDLVTDQLPAPGDAPVDGGPGDVWGVIIRCADEREQLALLERFEAEQLDVRALIQ